MVIEVLSRHACNVTDAAADLGMPASDLRRLMWANPKLQDEAFEVGLTKQATPQISVVRLWARASNRVGGVRTCRHAVERGMEPERPKVDRAVLGFLKSEALHPADFTIRADGV